MIRPFWGIAAAAFLGTTGVVGAVVVTSSGGTEEAVQVHPSASPSALPSLTPSPRPSAVPSPSETPSAPSPTPTALPGGQAPGGCVSGEQVYQDPAERFAFCYPADMQVGTSEPYEGKTGVRVGYAIGDPEAVEVLVGWDQYPAYVPCQEAGEGLEARNRRFQDLTIDGGATTGCFQDLYPACKPGASDPPCDPGAFYLTTIDFAVPVTTGRSVLVLVAYAGDTVTRDGVALPAIWRRILDSARIY